MWTKDDAILLEHAPDPECFTILRDGWDMFWHFVATDTPPPLTEGDTVVRTDEAWAEAARQYIALSDQADEIADESSEIQKFKSSDSEVQASEASGHKSCFPLLIELCENVVSTDCTGAL